MRHVIYCLVTALFVWVSTPTFAEPEKSEKPCWEAETATDWWARYKDRAESMFSDRAGPFRSRAACRVYEQQMPDGFVFQECRQEQRVPTQY